MATDDSMVVGIGLNEKFRADADKLIAAAELLLKAGVLTPEDINVETITQRMTDHLMARLQDYVTFSSPGKRG